MKSAHPPEIRGLGYVRVSTLVGFIIEIYEVFDVSHMIYDELEMKFLHVLNKCRNFANFSSCV
jgi:hypothetical protein